MIKVLHIMAGADAGGISAVVLNYYKYIDRERFSFDIAITTDAMGQNGKLLRALGAKFYKLPLKSNGLHAYEESLEKLLKEHHYDVVHVHESETSYIALRVAKKVGVKCRIAHSHTTSPWYSIKGELRRLSGCWLNCYYATDVIGCGKMAGERVFGKNNMKRDNAYVLPNAVETKKFCFNAELRKSMRQQLGCEKKFIVGMIGRLAKQKNYIFALEFFRQVYKYRQDAHLMIAGNGPDEGIIRSYIKEHSMSEYVTLLGRRDDVDMLYQAFDILIMPSLYEGFPVVAVEGMASGLPVLLSDTITDELSFGKHVRYLPLEQSVWADAIINSMPIFDRYVIGKQVSENGLDLNDCVRILENIYLRRLS